MELDQVYLEDCVQKQCNVDSVKGLTLKESKEGENKMWKISWTFLLGKKVIKTIGNY